MGNILIILIIACITFIVPLSYLLMNFFIDKILFSSGSNSPVAKKRFLFYMFFTDNATTEIFLNGLFLVVYYYSFDKFKYDEYNALTIVIIFLIFKFILNYLRDSYDLLISGDFIKAIKSGPINIIFGGISSLIILVLFLTPLLVILVDSSLVNIEMNLESIIFYILLGHLFAWIFLVELWRPAAFLVATKRPNRTTPGEIFTTIVNRIKNTFGLILRKLKSTANKQ